MKYINPHNLPDAFARAVINDPYTKGKSDFSATGLQNPPRAIVLIEQFGDSIEIDVSSRVATTIGQGVHSILERARRPGIDIIEKRYFHGFLIDGVLYTVSAQIDIFETDTGTLSDWKTTKTYAFHKKAGPKPEWVAQMNIGAYLMKRNGLEVKSLQIIGLLKDWDRKKSLTEEGYPKTEIMNIGIPIWDENKTREYIETRIRAIVQARSFLPRCSAKETWSGNRCAQ